MNTDSALDEAILHSELRHINFFNGRLLTGGDLEAEQSVQHAHSRHLGEAIGEGVAFGLQVARADASPPGGPIVSVTAGLAVNRAGQTLRLECDQRVALTRSTDPAARDACIFDDCEPAGTGATLASGTPGYYVLTIGPASRPDGKAPVSGLGNTTAVCNSRFFAEGVKFRLFRLAVAADSTPRARSLLARDCFGLASDISSGAWPGSLPIRYGWETRMPPGFERDRQVPIAVLEWTSAGLGFLKRWPVCRRIAAASAVDKWSYFTSARRVAEGEAMFLDFQDDVSALGLPGFAADRFSFLPPGGVLPAEAPRRRFFGAFTPGGVSPFEPAWKTFLGPLAPPFVTPIDASLWPRLLRDSFTREPVAIPAKDAMTFDAASFAAIKVYEVPGRAERLFARSPLGRLRIFPAKPGGVFPMITGVMVIRDANGCVRFSEWRDQNAWPVIADDLPGGLTELWFFLATPRGPGGPSIEPGPPKEPIAQESSLGNTARKKSSRKTAARAAAGPAAGSEFETVSPDLRGQFSSESMATLLGQVQFNPHVTAQIVNGRTTDIMIPTSEQPNQPKG